jgi:hypothetical protein
MFLLLANNSSSKWIAFFALKNENWFLVRDGFLDTNWRQQQLLKEEEKAYVHYNCLLLST